MHPISISEAILRARSLSLDQGNHFLSLCKGVLKLSSPMYPSPTQWTSRLRRCVEYFGYRYDLQVGIYPAADNQLFTVQESLETA